MDYVKHYFHYQFKFDFHPHQDLLSHLLEQHYYYFIVGMDYSWQDELVVSEVSYYFCLLQVE